MACGRSLNSTIFQYSPFIIRVVLSKTRVSVNNNKSFIKDLLIVNSSIRVERGRPYHSSFMIRVSSLVLKESSDGAILTPTGRRFHFWITRYEKKLCLCFRPFVARLFTRRAPLRASLTSQNSEGSIRVSPLRILKTSIMSPLSLLCSNVISPSSFLLSSEFLCLIP